MPGSASKAIHRKAGGPPWRDWNTQRWAWLDAVHSDRGVSDRARLLADVLCRRLANNQTGLCIHTLDYVAAQLCKSKRTTQRALQELEQRGWVRAIRRCGRSGFVRFHFEKVAEASQITRRKKVTDLSSRRSEKVPNQTLKHDRSDAPNIEPNINQSHEGNAPSRKPICPYPTLFVAEDDDHAIADWNKWLIANGFEPLSELDLNAEQDGQQGFMLPSRYAPRDQYTDRVEYARRHFKDAREREGEPRPNRSRGDAHE